MLTVEQDKVQNIILREVILESGRHIFLLRPVTVYVGVDLMSVDAIH